MLQVKQFSFNHFQVNCYVIWDEQTKRCAIVDPGAETDSEQTQLTRFIESSGLTPTFILLTHAHIDHIAGLRQTCEHYNLPVTLHHDGEKLLHQAHAYGGLMGFDVPNMGDLGTNIINDGDLIKLSDDNPQATIEARFTPGHCEGSICYVLHNEQMILTGDALFRMSIGRTDLPGGDYDQLINSLRTKVLTLDGDYLVLPGHGDCSTIADELNHNPFF